MGYFLHSLAKMKEKASPSDRKIIQYILNNPLAISSLSIDKLSEKTGTSYATISRFCKKMGFDGFKDVKQQLLEELNEDYYIYSTEAVEHTKKILQIKQEINNLYMKILKDCQVSIKEEILDKAAAAMINAHEIYFIGQGTSSVTAKYAYLKFLRLGLPCSHDEDVTTIKTKTSIMRANDVLLAVSSSGRTKPVIEAALAAQQSGAAVISITDFDISPLSNIADIKLSTTLRDFSQYLNEDFPLTAGQIELIDILQSVCITKLSYNAARMLKMTKEQVKTEKI